LFSALKKIEKKSLLISFHQQLRVSGEDGFVSAKVVILLKLSCLDGGSRREFHEYHGEEGGGGGGGQTAQFLTQLSSVRGGEIER